MEQPIASVLEKFKATIKYTLRETKKSTSTTIIRYTLIATSASVAIISSFIGLASDLSNRDITKIIDSNYIQLFFITICALTILYAVFMFFDYFRHYRLTTRFKPLYWNNKNFSNKNSEEILSACNADNSYIDGAIEVFRHPFLGYEWERNGWPLTEVNIKIYASRSPPPELRSDVDIPGENGPKYSLIYHSSPSTDNYHKLTLHASMTDWYTVQRSLKNIRENRNILLKYVNLDPSLSSVPSILCLHFVCLTADGYFLALRRKQETPYYPGALSISFEEQMSSEDIADQNSWTDLWFRRAICEEIFPLSKQYKLSPQLAWNSIKDEIADRRIWSCILESESGNFSLMGVCILKHTLVDFVDFCKSLPENEFKRDNEGRLYYLQKEDVAALLSDGRSQARPLFKPEHGPISVVYNLPPSAWDSRTAQLHPTALYRADIVMTCLARNESEIVPMLSGLKRIWRPRLGSNQGPAA